MGIVSKNEHTAPVTTPVTRAHNVSFREIMSRLRSLLRTCLRPAKLLLIVTMEKSLGSPENSVAIREIRILLLSLPNTAAGIIPENGKISAMNTPSDRDENNTPSLLFWRKKSDAESRIPISESAGFDRREGRINTATKCGLPPAPETGPAAKEPALRSRSIPGYRQPLPT